MSEELLRTQNEKPRTVKCRTCVIPSCGAKVVDGRQNVLEMGVNLIEAIHAQNVTLLHTLQRRTAAHMLM